MEYEIPPCYLVYFLFCNFLQGHVVSLMSFLVLGDLFLFGVWFVLDSVLWVDVLWVGGNEFIWVGLFGVSGWVMFQSC